jgi:hypothetical protein
MALALDGFKVLRRIGKNADCFGHITADVNKAAHALLLKRIKAKSATPLKSLRDVADILGGGSFSLFVDGLTDTEVKSVLTRSDKHSPLIRYANAGERRIHLVALAEGKIESAQKAAATRAAKKTAALPPATTEPPRLTSEAMAAVRRRD